MTQLDKPRSDKDTLQVHKHTHPLIDLQAIRRNGKHEGRYSFFEWNYVFKISFYHSVRLPWKRERVRWGLIKISFNFIVYLETTNHWGFGEIIALDLEKELALAKSTTDTTDGPGDEIWVYCMFWHSIKWGQLVKSGLSHHNSWFIHSASVRSMLASSKFLLKNGCITFEEATTYFLESTWQENVLVTFN